TWDVDRGLSVDGQQAGGAAAAAAAAAAATDPIAAVRAINALATPDGSALLVLANFHRFLSSAEVVQAVAHQVEAGKANRTFIIILAPVVQLPVELEVTFI